MLLIPEPDVTVNQDLIEPTNEEVKRTTQMLKNGKFPEEYDIVSELLKKVQWKYIYIMPNKQKWRYVRLQKIIKEYLCSA